MQAHRVCKTATLLWSLVAPVDRLLAQTEPDTADRQPCTLRSPPPASVYLVNGPSGVVRSDTVPGQIVTLLCDRPDVVLSPLVVIETSAGRRFLQTADLMELPLVRRDPETNMTSRLLVRGKANHLEPLALRRVCDDSCIYELVSGQGWIDEERARSMRERAADAEAAARAKADRERRIRTAAANARMAEAKARAAEARDRAAAEASERAREASIRSRGWLASTADLVIAHKVAVGMTPDMVRESWGRPAHIHHTITAAGRTDQWVYESGNYVYFDNEVVVSIQTSE